MEIPEWAIPVINSIADAVRINKNTVRGLCPVHGGHSLDITYTDDKLLLHCFGGCDNRNVVAALGLQFSDLFAPHKRVKRSRKELRVIANRHLQQAAAAALDFERAILVQFRATPDDLLISHVDMARVKIANTRFEMAMGTQPWRPTTAVKQGPEFSFESIWELREYPFKSGRGHG